MTDLAPAPAHRPHEPDSAVAHRINRRDRVRRLTSFMPPVVLIVLVIVFAAGTDSFLTRASLLTMGSSAGILFVAAAGLTFVVVTGGIDMSIGSIAMLSGATLAVLAGHDGQPIAVLLIAPLLIALAGGALNGVVTVYGKVPSFIVTLGSLSVLSGLALTLLDGSAQGFFNQTLLDLVNTQWLPGVSGAFGISVAVLVAAWIVTRRTRFGVYMYAIGSNERVAALSGVKVARVKFGVFVISGLLAGAAGLLSASQIQSAGPTLGSSLLLDSIAALAIGGTSLAGGAGGVGRTFVGALILAVLSSGLNQWGVPDFTQTMIKGAVVIVAATLTLAGRRGGVVK